MTDDFKSPSDQDFRVLRQALPALKRGAAQKRRQKARDRIDPNAKFCTICGDKVSNPKNTKTPCCHSCQKRLDDGDAAFIVRDINNPLLFRFTFVKPMGNLEMMQKAGRIGVVSAEVLDAIEAKNKSQNEQN